VRYAVAILVVTTGLVAAVWLHGLQRSFTIQVAVGPPTRTPYVGSVYATVVRSERIERHPGWADLAAVAAIGTSLALAVVIVTVRH
jgi:Na+/glutamate symporter